MRRLRHSIKAFLALAAFMLTCMLLFSVEDALGLNSTCSHWATMRGSGQKVVSYSFFGPLGDEKGNLNWFSKGLLDNAPLIPVFYGRDWVMRVYHDEMGENPERYEFLKKLGQNFDHVDLCYVGSIPSLGDVKEVLTPTTWRFLPMADPLVSEFHSRDLDSRPSQRELAALAEFRNHPDATFHVMRDHREHHALILAGMWGARLTGEGGKRRELVAGLFKEIVERRSSALDETKISKFTDQELLLEVVGPILDGRVLAHDSYNCAHYPLSKTVGWPTERKQESYNFVGCQMFGHIEVYADVCPPPCRPVAHKEWRYC